MNNQHIEQDPIILRSKTVLPRPRARVIEVVLESGPLTVVKARTVKGEEVYAFKARSKKYARKQEMGAILYKLLKKIYNDHQKAWRLKNMAHDKQRKKEWYNKNRSAILQRQKEQYHKR